MRREDTAIIESIKDSVRTYLESLKGTPATHQALDDAQVQIARLVRYGLRDLGHITEEVQALNTAFINILFGLVGQAQEANLKGSLSAASEAALRMAHDFWDGTDMATVIKVEQAKRAGQITDWDIIELVPNGGASTLRIIQK